jgi:hypothetical protein
MAVAVDFDALDELLEEGSSSRQVGVVVLGQDVVDETLEFGEVEVVVGLVVDLRGELAFAAS